MASGNAPISRFRRHVGVTDVTDVLFHAFAPAGQKKLALFSHEITFSYLFYPPFWMPWHRRRGLSACLLHSALRWQQGPRGPEGAPVLPVSCACAPQAQRQAAVQQQEATRRELARPETTRRAAVPLVLRHASGLRRVVSAGDEWWRGAVARRSGGDERW